MTESFLYQLIGEKIVKKIMIVLTAIFMLILAGCGGNDNEASNDEKLTPVSFVLDWTPNTNHTGIYVAQAEGYFEEAGLDVEILLPGEVPSTQLISSGKADFGIDFQEHVIMARDEGMPIVSVAAIIQHNTAGYASPVEKGITEPKDFEGKVFGAYGSDIERAMLETIAKENGADIDKITFQNIGDADFFVAVERDIDFALVYQGWTGIEADLRDQDLNMVYLKDFSEALDFYTPIIASNEKMLEENPEIAKKFIEAAVKGYEFAIEHPEQAAEILIEAEPDLDEDLVYKSQAWLANKYQDDAAQFGMQSEERWEVFHEFMLEYDLIEAAIDLEAAYTNEYLPKKEK